MTHERHADFLHDAGFHEPGAETVSEIVKADMPDTSPPQSAPPRRFDDSNRTALVGEDNSGFLSGASKQVVHTLGERNFTGLAFWCLGSGYKEKLPGKVHMLPTLAGDFAAAHAGVERRDDHALEVFGSRVK